MYYLVKIIASVCSTLLISIIVFSIIIHGGLPQSNNLNCFLQCLTSPLNESIPVLLEQRSSCLADKKQLVSRSQKLAIYENHLLLIELIDNYTRALETCRVWLKEYCDLKKDEKSLTDDQNDTLKKFASWLGCKEPLPEANHYTNILPSFKVRRKHISDNRKRLEGMLITGDFENMKIAQEKAKNLPSESCQFLCTYQTENEEKEVNTDPNIAKTTLMAILSKVSWWLNEY